MYWLFLFFFFPFHFRRRDATGFNLIALIEWSRVGGIVGECFFFFYLSFFVLQASRSAVVPGCRACDWDGDGVGTSEWRVSSFFFFSLKLQKVFHRRAVGRFSWRIPSPTQKPIWGLLIGSRGPACKLCSIETQLLSVIPCITSSHKLFIDDLLFFSSRSLVQLTRRRRWQHGPMMESKYLPTNVCPIFPVKIFLWRQHTSIECGIRILLIGVELLSVL